VLPASMCAMMPMFRVLFNGTCLGIFYVLLRSTFELPPIVGERLVRLCHAMRVFALLHGPAAKLRRVEELAAQLLLQRLAVAARACVADQPADAERQAAVRIHFDRHLIVAAADAPRLHLETRLDVVDRLLEHLDRIVAGLLFDDVEALIEDAL